MDIQMLKKIMREKEITPTDLARKAEIAQSTVSQILNEKRKDPSFSTVCKIAYALDIDIDVFKGEWHEI